MLDIPCVLFAGGKSSRMGEDKALLPFAGFTTLSEYQYTRLCKIFSNVFITCKDKSKFPFEANFLEDDKRYGLFAPTLGFLSAFNTLDTQKIFVMSIDTPFITQQEIQKIVLADKATLSDITIAKTDEGIQPLCGIYSKKLQNSFLQMLQNDEHKLGYLVKNSHSTYVYFPDAKPFLNMNHPEDYKKALQFLSHY